MELEPEEEEIAMTTEGWGFLRYLALGGRWVCGERSRFGMRLNSKKMEDGSTVSHSTRSQLQRRCVFLGGCSEF